MFDGVKKAVMFCSHSDDEFICAGTLHRLVRQGCAVHIITFAPAATISDRTGTEKSADIVKEEWKESLRIIGATGTFCGLTPSADFQRHRQTICQMMFDYCESEKPDCVFTLSPEDENTAHAVVGVESERVLRGRVPLAIRCQFPWNLSFGRGNLFVTLSEADLEAKKRVIAAYASQAFRYRYGEMLLAYARADALSVKVEPAVEKFEIIRAVV